MFMIFVMLNFKKVTTLHDLTLIIAMCSLGIIMRLGEIKDKIGR